MHGQKVTLTALVTPQYGTISGTVTFKSGSTVLGTGSVNAKNKEAQVSTVFKSAGKYSLEAVYNPGTGFQGSHSAVLGLTVR